MGKINETDAAPIFSFYGNADSANGGSTGISPLGETDFLTPDAYKGSSFLEDGRFRRLSFTRNNPAGENFGVGGAAPTKDSTPAELLRDPRVRAMLDTIAFAEGTGDNYGRVVYGTVLGASDRSAPFDRSLVGRRNVVTNDFNRHPNLAVRWANGQPPSSAAGRYQFLYSTWNGLNMPDFSPRSQDLGAIKLMQRRGMIEPLLRGDFAAAIHKGAPEWAALPIARGGSYYGGQGARTLDDLRSTFSNSLRRHLGTQPTTNQPPPTSTNTNTNGVLTRGNRGAAVENLQNRLIRFGLMTEAQRNTGVGIFGPRTENAVKKFQASVGLNESGRVDNATRRALNDIATGEIKKGARGETVKSLQDNLVRLGYLTPAQVNTGPGIFGPRTDAALRRFQSEHNLTRDGIFGANTFREMQSATPRRGGANPDAPRRGVVPEYSRWNVYSTGDRPARLADGREDLQPHHDYQSVNYVMRGLRLNHRLEARDIVLTRPGQSNFGQAVPSPLAGRVLFAGNENDGYGNKVVIKNDRTGQITLVGHLQTINVRRGATVAYGQNLGGQGSTGNSSGAHVHINADASVIRRWTADLADGRFDGVRARFDIGRRP